MIGRKVAQHRIGSIRHITDSVYLGNLYGPREILVLTPDYPFAFIKGNLVIFQQFDVKLVRGIPDKCRIDPGFSKAFGGFGF